MQLCRPALVFAAVVLSLSLFAQNAPPQAAITLRSSARLVVFDAVVTDAAGHPITGLQQDAFTVLEDGVTQKITSFQGPDSHPTADNDAAPALTILVLDELNSSVHDQAYARVSLRKFFRKHGPRLAQPTALMLLGQRRLELLHDYTRDSAALTRALDQRHAELPFGLMTNDLRTIGDRMAKTLWALQQIGAANQHYAARKNVVWVGSGFPSLNPLVSLTAEDRHKFAAAVSEDATLLLEARVVVYTVDPHGIESAPLTYAGQFLSDNADQVVFESIAPETGGEIFRLRNDIYTAISNSVEDGASYYTLAYYPGSLDWNGKFRNVQITVNGKDLKVRARKGYFAVADTPLSDDEVETVLTRAVRSPLRYHALNVSASARTTRPEATEFTIKVARDTLSWQMLPNGDRRSEITVVVATVGAADQVYSHKVTELESVLDSAHFEASRTVTFALPSEMPPNTWYARIVVRDTRNGNIGSADLGLDSLPMRHAK